MSDDVLREFLVSLGFKVDETGMKKFTLAVEKVTKGVMQAGVAVTAATTAIVAGVAIISSQMEKLYYASQRTGESVGNIQALRYAAEQVGLTADQAQSSLEGFTRTLRLNPGSNNLLASLGVTGDSPMQKFESFIAKMKEMQPYIAAQYASLFGIDPDTLLMLENGLPKLEEEQRKYKEKLGAWGINSDKAASSGKDFNNAIRSLKADFELLWVVIESKLVPVIVPLIDQFERWARSHADEMAKAIADAVQELANWIQSVDWDETGKRIDKVVDALGGVKGVLVILAGLSFAGTISGIVGMATAIAQLVGAAAGLGGGAAVAGAGAAGAAGGASALATAGTVAAGVGVLALADWVTFKVLDWLMPNHKRGDIDPDTGLIWEPGPNGRGGKWVTPEGGAYRHFIRGGRAGGGRWEGQAIPSSSAGQSTPSSTPASANSALPRGVRNNNPGNIEYGAFTKSQGAIGSDGRFAVFASMEEGIQATMKLLHSYANCGFDTIRKIIEKWAPSKENNTKAYIADLSKKLGISADKQLSEGDLQSVAQGIFGHENGSGYGAIDALMSASKNTKLGATEPQTKNVVMSQKTEIHVTGTSDPQSTAKSIANEQARVNSDMLRNTTGAVA